MRSAPLRPVRFDGAKRDDRDKRKRREEMKQKLMVGVMLGLACAAQAA